MEFTTVNSCRKVESFKGYKKLRDEILEWAKNRYLNTVKIIYHPDNESFIKAFEIEWNKDPECKDFSLEIFSHELAQKDAPILTGKNSKTIAEGTYGIYLPRVSSGTITR